MIYNKITNKLAENLVISNENSSFLDGNNILWKITENGWVGKRSVYTFNLQTLWLEDTNFEDIKTWWCGINSDYNEIFKNNK